MSELHIRNIQNNEVSKHISKHIDVDNYTLITIICIWIWEFAYRDFDQGDIVLREILFYGDIIQGILVGDIVRGDYVRENDVLTQTVEVNRFRPQWPTMNNND